MGSRLSRIGRGVAMPLLGGLLAGCSATGGEADQPRVVYPGAPVAVTGQKAACPDEGSGRTALTWMPPELTEPEVLEISTGNRKLDLEDDRDYIIELPDEPLELEGGLTIRGGNDVVLIGGEIRVPEIEEAPEAWQRRGLYARDQTGTLHIEGIRLSGKDLAEGISLNQPKGATVQIQAVEVETVSGSRDRNHADVLQTWAGPNVLRVDRLSGSTGYQGLFLLPHQYDDDIVVEEFDLRRINIIAEPDAKYLLWTEESPPWLSTCDVHLVTPDGFEQRIWPDAETWPGVSASGVVRSDPLDGIEPGVDYPRETDR